MVIYDLALHVISYFQLWKKRKIFDIFSVVDKPELNKDENDRRYDKFWIFYWLIACFLLLAVILNLK